MADILFTCPHCSKSLAIDDKGAGLTINCPDCQNPTTIPQPTIFLRCSSCKSELSAPEELKGEIRNCPACNKEVILFSQTTSSLKATCPKCNATCSPDARFCVNCGMSLKGNTPSVTMPLSSYSLKLKQQEHKTAYGTAPEAQSKLCPKCSTPLSADSVICINCGTDYRTGKQIETISARTSFSQTQEDGHMLFVTCPKCGANDLYAICTNCHRFGNFRSSGMSAECSCGQAISDQFNCIHCQTLIFKKSFAPDSEREDLCRKKLPRDGKVNASGNYIQMFFNILLRPHDTEGKIMRAVFFIALFFFLIRSPGCSEKERYWYDQGHGKASSWLQGSFGAEYESRSDDSLNEIAKGCSCPSEYFSNFNDGYRKALDENNELHYRLTPH